MVGAGLVFGLVGAPTFASVTISGQFTPLAILQGDRSRMRINFQSNDTVNPVLLANFINLLPAPLVLYGTTSPGYVAPQGDCNSTTEAGQTIVTSPAFITTTGNNRVDLVNGTIPIAPNSGSGSCFIEVDVTVPSGPTTSYTNTLVRANFTATPATTVDGSTNPQFSLNVTALSPLTATKTFGTNPLAQGNTTTATIVVTNPVANGTAAIRLTTFSDTLPANLSVVGTPTATCTSGINPTVTSAANTSPITTSGGTIAGNGGTCTITATVRGILTAPATSAAGTNTLPTNAFGNIRGLPLAVAVNTPITVNSPIRLSKTFSPNPLSLGQAASATITIFNDSSALLTGVTLDDDTATGRWPPQIDNSGAPVIGGTSVGCTAPDLIAGAGSRGFRLGSTIPATIGAGGRCVISVPITSNTASAVAADWTNTIPLNAVGNNEGFTAPAVSARLDVRNTLPNVTKTVNRVTVAPGDLVTYVVSITTFNPVAQTGVTFTDTLPSNNGGQQAILAAAPGATLPVLAGAGCNPASLVVTGTTAAPTFTFDLPASDADGVTCTVTFQARVSPSAVPGVNTNPNASGAITGPGISSSGASAPGLGVLQPLTLFKRFNGVAAASVSQGTVAQLTITLTNNNYTALSSVALTDTLPTSPGNIVIANPPNASTTCSGGAVTAVPGAGAVSLANGTIAARNFGDGVAGTCVIQVDVIGGAVGAPTAHNNIIPIGGVTASIPTSSATGNAGAPTAVANTVAASATLQYTPALTAVKTFLTNPVNTGGVSRVRITLGNIGAAVLTNVSVNDPVASIAGIALAASPNASTTCTGPTAISTAGGNLALSGATISPGGTCDLLVDVVATNGTASNNIIPIGGISADNGIVLPSAVSATLTKSAGAVSVSKNFSPIAVNSPGAPSRLTITVTNTGAITLTNVGVPDNLPSGLKIAAVPNANTIAAAPGPSNICPGGIVSAPANGTLITLSGATLAPGQSCEVNVDVVNLVVGAATNTIPVGAVTSNEGITNTSPFSANLASQQNVGVQKEFTPAAAAPNVPVTLTLRVNNTLGVGLSGLTLTDNLPTNMLVAPLPSATNTCGGAFSPVAGASTFALSGGSLPAGPSSCVLTVQVIGTTIGAFTNTIPPGGVSSNGGAVSNPLPATSATLNVLNPATISKAFSVSPVRAGTVTRLTVTINNPNTTALTSAALIDNLPSGLFVAPTPNTATTCSGGVVTALASGSSMTLTGATIPAGAPGSCTFSIDTVSNTPGTYTNTIAANALTTAQGVSNPAPASAPVQIFDFPSVAKSFNPAFTQVNLNSVLTITLGNTNASALTLAAALDDNLPSGVTVAGVPGISGTCPGLPATVNVTLNTRVRYNSGSSIPAGGCTINVNVTSAVAGTYTNTIPAGALTTTQAGANQSSATATVVFSPLGTISGRIYRDFNNNGAVDGSDTGISGQTVELLDGGGAVIQSAVTDPSGNYQFSGLSAGTYSVRQPTQPAGTLDGKNSAGTIVNGTGTAGTPSANGQASVGAPSRIDNITLNLAGFVSSSPNNNFGELVPSQVSGRVYNDFNNNGVIEGSEPGINAVPVTLSGFDDLGNPVLIATTTDATGNYAFANLRPSCGSAGAAVCPGGNPAGYTITEGTQAANTANGRETAGTVSDLTSGAASGTAGTISNNSAPLNGNAPAGTSRIAAITLPSNARSQNNNLGEIPNNRVISGRIFTDVNGDGTVNGADAGVGAAALAPNNVAQTLTLTGTDVAGTVVNLATTTDASGNYSFGNLLPGSYTVTCTTCAAPSGFSNGQAFPGSTGGAAGGTTAVPVISAIDLRGLSNTNSTANNFNKTQASGAISGRIYRDNNNNGAFDGTDVGIGGQTVRLLDSGGAQLSTTTTAGDGSYSFTGLAGGTYTVEEPAQPAGTLNGITTAGTISGTGTAGTATALAATPSRIASITLQSSGGTVATSPNNNFGEVLGSIVSGRVYNDFNNNGVVDGAETGILGVGVTLSGFDATGAAVVLNTTTDAAGNYAFNGLLASCGSPSAVACPGGNLPGYTITEGTQAANTANGRETAGAVTDIGTGGNVGTPGTISNNSAPLNGNAPAGTSRIASITLPQGANSLANNFGEIPNNRSISGRIFTDGNGNGVFDGADAGVGSGAAGVNNVAQTLTLTGTNVAGTAINLTTTTDNAGNYSFGNLLPGSYTVTCTTCTPPSGFLNGQGFVGSTGGTAGGTTAVPLISGIDLTGATNTASTANNFNKIQSNGAISGRIFRDDNNNGLFDGTESGIGGQTVRLLDSGGAQITTTVTAGDGTYSFAGLSPGTYSVEEPAQPANTTNGITTPGTLSGPGTPGTATAIGVTPSRVSTIVLGTSGAGVSSSPNNNFGEIPNNRSISGRIFTDLNANGTFDGADAGVGTGAAGVNNVAQTLTLTGTDVAGNAISVTTTTDNAGNYTFGSLLPGTYTVTCTTCTAPTGFNNGSAFPGSTGGTAGGSVAVPVISGINLTGSTNTTSTANNFNKTQSNGSISGRIYRDDNNDGLFNGTEPGIGGQTVRLLDSGGAQITTTVTAGDGTYSFTGLTPATYSVEEPAQPPNTTNGITTPGTLTGPGTAGTATVPAVTPSRISTIVLGSALGVVTNSPNNNFGEIPNNRSISGRIFTDLNSNGSFDGADAGVGTGAAGVNNVPQTLTLTGTDVAGNAISVSTTTDNAGNYSFGNLLPGTYTVTCTTCTPPAGFSNGSALPGSSGGTAGGSTAVPVISGINLTGSTNTTSTANNFNKTQVAGSISGRIYRDDNNDGLFNGTEPGIGGQTVRLLDSGGAQITTTVTAGDGTYSFTGLTPATYSVEEPAQPPNTTNGITTPGSLTGPGTAGTATVPAVTPSRISTIVLGSALGVVTNSPNNNFGEIPNNRSISGRIFTDLNSNGAFDGADAGVGTGAAGVNNVPQTLTLTGTDVAGNAISVSTTTDNAGNYSFGNLLPGTYTVTCTTCAAPAGFGNGQAIPGATGGAAGGTNAVPVISAINLTGSTNTTSTANNFSKTQSNGAISGRIFRDDNNDGLINGAETGIAGQTVRLLDAGGVQIATTVTLADGSYTFSGLPAGTYSVEEPVQPPNTNNGISSAGTLAGPGTAGTATAPTVAPSRISTIVLGSALGVVSTSTGNNFGEIQNNRSISGRVFTDLNDSGTVDAGDLGVGSGAAGVNNLVQTLTLTGTNVAGTPVSVTTTTDLNGNYTFGNLLPGTYSVTCTSCAAPAGFGNGRALPGATGGSAGGSAAVPLISAIDLTGSTNTSSTANNFNKTQSNGVISGRVYRDDNNNGLIDGTETGIAGQTVRLLDGTGVQLATTVTAADGSYSFTGLAPGTYTVEEPSQPSGTNNGMTTAGTIVGAGTAGTATLPSVTPSRIANITLQSTTGNVATSPNNNFGEQAGSTPASLSGFVWRDNNSDRRRDPGDTPIPNWGVAVYTSAGVLVPCTAFNSRTACVVMPDGRSLFRTDATGAYNVTGLVPGPYKIEFRDPSNNVVFGTPQNSSNDPGSRVANTRDALNVNLSPGQNMVQQDLPLDPSGVIYDSVTRQPIAGARVELCGPPGFNPATMLVGGASYTLNGQCAAMPTGPNGFYQYLLTSTATPGTYTLGVTAPAYAPAPSGNIPPAPGPFTPAGPTPLLVQAQAGPPPVGSPTTYYLALNLAPGVPDLLHNHIPLDPFGGTGLFLQKQVNRDTVELGDSLQYTLRLTSPNGAVTNAVITDSLPAGFRLIPGTVTLNNAAMVNPGGSPGPVLSFNIGNLAANAIATITYRVRVGVGAQQGDGINRARANALNGGLPVSSNQAQARVKIVSGVFFQEACVIGKIFVDCNNNRIQDGEELGIPGVRMYLQDGTYIITDAEGAYSYCGLPARTAVIKVDASTLPLGAQLVTSSNRNALDANSLFLDLQIGGLHRAEFIEGSCSPSVLEQVKARRTKGNVVAPQVEKKPQPRLIFDSGSIRNSVPKERDDVMRSAPAGGGK